MDFIEVVGGPPPQFCPWFSRFQSAVASSVAFQALWKAAHDNHDLSPIVSFAQLWGPGARSEGKATAVAVYPTGRTATGEPGYEQRSLGGEALAIAAFHPVKDDELCNSLFFVRPGGGIDPTSVPLAELGLDVPGVDRRFVNFCAGWLDVDAVEEIWELRWGFEPAWPDYRETVRAGLLQLVRERPLSTEQWYGLTYQRFPGVPELTHYLAQLHACLFDTYPAMLRVYGMPSWKRT